MYEPTTELSARVIETIAEVAAAELRRVAQLIPASPAAELGRLAQPQLDPRGGAQYPPQARHVPAPGYGSAAKIGLADVPQLVAERLFGALELTVAGLDLSVPQLVEALPETAADGSEPRRIAIAHVGTASEMVVELSKLDAFVPGATDMAAYVVAALAAHPSIAPLLVGTGADEAAIAASHGARHLALTIVVAAIVLPPLWPSITPAAVVGAALGIAAPFLREAPMPAAYSEAALAKRRAEYLMPRSGHSQAVITDHVIALAEGPLESAVDFSENGLVAVLPNGIAVRSGQESGSVSVTLSVVEEPAELNPDVWDEIVDVSWYAPNGGAAFAGSGETTQITPPWPGDYRVRVCARGRDEGREEFGFVVWRADAADAVVHKRSDKLGFVLRGEPVPATAIAPDEAYHWVETSWLSVAATVGLLAATRFTGISLSADDLKRIQTVDIGYPILPLLPDLRTEQRLTDGSRRWPGHGPLGADTDRLAAVPDDELRDLAWWIAAFAAAHSELAQHPAVTATLAARALTAEAEELTRRSQLHEHRMHRWLWMTLHAATNPDPLGAAIGSLDAGRYAVAGHAAELLEQVRGRLG